MAKSKIRLILALIVLAVSLILLVWAFWPLTHLTRFLPIPPGNLQLPTPGGYVPALWPAC